MNLVGHASEDELADIHEGVSTLIAVQRFDGKSVAGRGDRIFINGISVDSGIAVRNAAVTNNFVVAAATEKYGLGRGAVEGVRFVVAQDRLVQEVDRNRGVDAAANLERHNWYSVAFTRSSCHEDRHQHFKEW